MVYDGMRVRIKVNGAYQDFGLILGSCVKFEKNRKQDQGFGYSCAGSKCEFSNMCLMIMLLIIRVFRDILDVQNDDWMLGYQIQSGISVGI